MYRPPLSRLAQVLLLAALASLPVFAESLPPMAINQNHAPPGVLRDGVLTIHLEIGKGEWHPEAEDGLALTVYAFGEEGHPLQNPGPLMRVPQGTEIHASVHNTLSVPINVHGLAESGSGVLRVAAGATERVSFNANSPGLYFYWGALDDSDGVKLRKGMDAELTGALVVDPPGGAPKDEVFVIEMISDVAGAGSTARLATINGKSWPFTQRFQYNIGETAHWRWINATNEPHAMHLHGFYFRIDATNLDGHVQKFTGDARPLVVTHRVVNGETFDMSWSPDRPGRWLFHCHMMIHMTPSILPVPGVPMRQAATAVDSHQAMGETAGMGQLVLGITVPAPATMPPGPVWQAERKLQLIIGERPVFPRYALELRDPAQGGSASSKPGLIGPPIVLTRGQPTEIEVVNELQQPTAIHWHGIELESYYDGVPGWTGSAAQSTPPIPPGTSFVAHITPPRAGTFIYHTHWHDESQLTNGIYGALIVMPPGEKYDAASDLPFVFGIGIFGDIGRLTLINGTPEARPLLLHAGTKYRFRLINITTDNQAMQVSLQGAHGPVDWRIIAKDGAELPAAGIQPSKARLNVTVGETYDVEFVSEEPQELLLEALMPGLKTRSVETLVFAASAPGKTTADGR
jgi:FtsP/CotA-like multicopper oxidase with cupredoxin domain